MQKHTVDVEHWMWTYAEGQPGVTNPGRWLAGILADALGRHRALTEIAEATYAVAQEFPPEGQQFMTSSTEQHPEPIIHHDLEFEKVNAEPEPDPIVDQTTPMVMDDRDSNPISVWDLPKARDGGRVKPLEDDSPCWHCDKWIKAGTRAYFRTNDDGQKEYYHAYHFIQNHQ